MIERTHYYISHQTEPHRNLAVEEQLLRMTEPGECILYLWQNANTVVIGKNQNARKECKADLLASEGGTMVRRLSGGGAVYHDLGNLNFTFLVREADYDVDRQLSVIIRALEYFGLHAEQTGRNDVVIDGRKFSGNAFYKSDGQCYHHGTLLISVDMEKLSRYLNVSLKKLRSKGVDSVRSRVINLSECSSEITIESMKAALIRAFGEIYGIKPELIEEESLPVEEIRVKEMHFSSEEWKLGKHFEYSCQLEERFGWGEIQLLFSVDGDRITECSAHSDAMDDAFIPRIAEVFCGCKFDRQTMNRALAALPADNEIQAVMKQDILKLIEESL